MAFVLLAFVAAALVGIQRADAQGGRLMAAVIGGTVRVHGILPAPSTESLDTAEAQALGPVFAALRAPEATVRPGHETRTAPTGAAATSVNVQRAVTSAVRPVEERLTEARPAAAKTVPAATSATKPRPTGDAAARDEKAAERAKSRAERAAAKAEKVAERAAARAEKAAEKLRERASRAAERALDRVREHGASITRWGPRDDHRRWQGRADDSRSAGGDRAWDRSRRVADWRDRDRDRSDRDRSDRDRSRRDWGRRDAGSRERRDRGDRSWGSRDRRDRGWDGSRSGRGSSRHGWNR